MPFKPVSVPNGYVICACRSKLVAVLRGNGKIWLNRQVISSKLVREKLVLVTMAILGLFTKFPYMFYWHYKFRHNDPRCLHASHTSLHLCVLGWDWWLGEAISTYFH